MVGIASAIQRVDLAVLLPVGLTHLLRTDETVALLPGVFHRPQHRLWREAKRRFSLRGGEREVIADRFMLSTRQQFINSLETPWIRSFQSFVGEGYQEHIVDGAVKGSPRWWTTTTGEQSSAHFCKYLCGSPVSVPAFCLERHVRLYG